MKKSFIILPILLLAVLLVYFFMRQNDLPDSIREQWRQSENSREPGETIRPPDTQVISENLEIPWEIAFLPDRRMLVTQRTGNLLIINPEDGSEKSLTVENVRSAGEGGLLGVALHPLFNENSFLYLYTTTLQGGSPINRVERYEFKEDRLENRRIIIDIPASQNHNGGRIKFGPDDKLYIATGDAGNSQAAQDLNSLAGKILRLNDNGSIPDDNPLFNSPVYVYGLRNPQGLAWDDRDNLWAVDHGRSGLVSGYDELNLIEKGKNYGWPIIQGPEQRENMETPVINSGSTTTWAPAGAAFLNGSIFFTGLRGETLYQYDTKNRELRQYFSGAYGRMRAIAIGPDGFVYIGTSNLDGRGEMMPEDDKIIKINPEILFRQQD